MHARRLGTRALRGPDLVLLRHHLLVGMFAKRSFLERLLACSNTLRASGAAQARARPPQHVSAPHTPITHLPPSRFAASFTAVACGHVRRM